MPKQCIIFDVDGTLSDPTHRLHHVTGEKKDWAAFFAGIPKDGCHEPIRWIADRLWSRAYIILCSGRPENCRPETETWLREHKVPHSALYMRPAGDFRPDHLVKSDLLDRIIADGYEPLFVVDDRPRVIAMWRARGLTCLQCREWKEDTSSVPLGTLTLMVGPTRAGKTRWALRNAACPSEVISSDDLRSELCNGDSSDQSKNPQIFLAAQAIAKARLSHGLPCIIDATNLHRKDRLAFVNLLPNLQVLYIVLDRLLVEKVKDAQGLPQAVICRHHQSFKSALPAILAGDSLPNVTVRDLRDPTTTGIG